MRVYELSSPEKYEWVTDADVDRFWLNLREIKNKKVADSWEPPEVVFLRKDGRQRFSRYSDLPWLGSGFLVVRSATLPVLRPILEPLGELLPLKCEEDNLHLFNPTAFLDVLDWEATRVNRFSDGGIMDIEAEVFYPKKLTGAKIFKLEGMPHSVLYFTDDAIKEVLSTGCRGVLFKPVWDSEIGIFKGLPLSTRKAAEIFVS